VAGRINDDKEVFRNNLYWHEGAGRSTFRA